MRNKSYYVIIIIVFCCIILAIVLPSPQCFFTFVTIVIVLSLFSYIGHYFVFVSLS